MTSIFNYNTLDVTLNTEHRSIEINLNRPEVGNAINFEMLFELETLFSWVASHIEINAIILGGVGDHFSTGIDQEELSKMSDEKMQRFLTKMQKLIYSLYFLPQTIITDIRSGAENIGAELASAADVRIISSEGKISFNHLSKGLVPCCGGISFLSSLVGTNFAKNWVLTGEEINATTLVQSGFVHKTYLNDCLDIRNHYLRTIAKQSPVARIQAKRSLLETHLKEITHGLDFEKDFAFAGHCTRDWENALKNETPEFTSAKSVADQLKRERNSTPLS